MANGKGQKFEFRRLPLMLFLRLHNTSAGALRKKNSIRVAFNYHKLCISRKVMNCRIWKKYPLFWPCLCW